VRLSNLMKLFAAIVLLGSSLLIVPTAQAAGGPVPSWCTNRNSPSCVYTWNWMTLCCNPTRSLPGAYCPQICE
jgi:hypothetical protein